MVIISFSEPICVSRQSWNKERLLQEINVPTPPRNLVITENVLGGIRLNWEPPLDNGGSLLLGYSVYFTNQKLGRYHHHLRIRGNETGIDLGKTYREENNTWVVTARNAIGESEYSNEVTLIIPHSSENPSLFPLIAFTSLFGSLTILLGSLELRKYIKHS
jgi:hypothetical protein